MPWYRTGTVSVVQNSGAVSGTNTAFVANCRVGDAFVGPDGRMYEVTNVASDTSISITPGYIGATASSASYALVPVQGYQKGLADQVRSWVNTYGGKMAALGSTGNYEVLPVEKGGTGGADQASARSSLGLIPTSSPTDTTPGRLVKVGDFGANGGDVTGLTPSVSWDTVTTPGEYVIYSATGANTPPGGGSFFITVRKFSNNFKQIAVSLTGSFSFSRLWNGTSWSAWDLSLSRANLLGTVSQASGVPTGAVIERGANSNGEYAKFADGTMICTAQSASSKTAGGANGSLFTDTATQVFTFPAAFIAPPRLIPTTHRASNSGGGPTWCFPTVDPNVTNPSTTGCSLNIASTLQNSNAYPGYVAIGRWF